MNVKVLTLNPYLYRVGGTSRAPTKEGGFPCEA